MQPYARINFPTKPKDGYAAKDIVEAIELEVESGRIPSGTRLPSVRMIQHQLGVAKQTVSRAFDELEARGKIEAASRQGYFVSSDTKFSSTHKKQIASPVKVQKGKFPPVVRLAKKGPEKIQLGSVFIDRELLPIESITKCFKSVLGTPGLHYMYDNQGYEPLRGLIAKRLKKRGIPADPEHIVITTGSQQALDIAVRGLEEKTIATENPAYGIGKLLFEMNQMQVTPLPIDPFRGADLESWEKAIQRSRPSLLYLTTNFQNPTGYSYSSSELSRILELSGEYGFGILEDDWGSDMLSFSEFKTPIRTIGGENVFYMNSFTKKLLPSLRIGYLVGNEQTIDALLAAKRVGSLGNPTLIEAALFEFLDRGYFDRHLRNLQQALDERYRFCLSALEELMPSSVRWTTPGGGPILWLELPRKISLEDLAVATAKRGILLDMRTSDWFFGPPHLHGTKVSFAQNSVEKLKRSLEILAEEIKKRL